MEIENFENFKFLGFKMYAKKSFYLEKKEDEIITY